MKNLREYRKKHGILQKELASQLGVAVSTFSGWESGAYEIDNRNLIKLSKLLNLSIEFLLDVENEPDIFDNARIEQPEILQLYERMTPEEQNNLVNYARGLISGRELRASYESRKNRLA